MCPLIWITAAAILYLNVLLAIHNLQIDQHLHSFHIYLFSARYIADIQTFLFIAICLCV